LGDFYILIFLDIVLKKGSLGSESREPTMKSVVNQVAVVGSGSERSNPHSFFTSKISSHRNSNNKFKKKMKKMVGSFRSGVRVKSRQEWDVRHHFRVR
jgi:hypothetical protein